MQTKAQASQAFTAQRFRRLFLAEAADLIASMERDLLRLQDEFAQPETIKSVFRAAHTLKGNSAMTGYHAAADLTHAIETALEALLARTRRLTPDLLENLLHATDCIREILDADPNDPIPPRAQAFREFLSGSETPLLADKNPRQETSSEVETYRITWVPAADCITRGADPIRCLSAIRTKATVLYSRSNWTTIPNLTHLNPERCHLTWQTTIKTNETSSTLRDWFNLIGPHQRLTIERNHEQPTPNQASSPLVQLPSTANAYLRIPTRKLNQLLTLLTRIRQDQTQAKSLATDQTIANDLLHLLERLERNTSLIEKEMQNLSKIELNEIFHRMPRLVHDLSIHLGKQIRIKMEGGEIRLDRHHAEHLTNALGHLIRNCADHGIEPPTDRSAVGKPIHGLIRIRAYADDRGQTILELSDDGRGIDYERLLKRATTLGILKKYEHLEKQQLTELIFLPGLSTANAITHNSGRGMGMDAVRASLESIRASITVFSQSGRGSTFRIALPEAPEPAHPKAAQVGINRQ